MEEVKYLGYVLLHKGMKPMPEKVSAILVTKPPTSVKQLCRFLGMVQYYRDLWEKRSQFLTPLINLVGKCGHTKVTKKEDQEKSLTLG